MESKHAQGVSDGDGFELPPGIEASRRTQSARHVLKGAEPIPLNDLVDEERLVEP